MDGSRLYELRKRMWMPREVSNSREDSNKSSNLLMNFRLSKHHWRAPPPFPIGCSLRWRLQMAKHPCHLLEVHPLWMWTSGSKLESPIRRVGESLLAEFWSLLQQVVQGAEAAQIGFPLYTPVAFLWLPVLTPGGQMSTFWPKLLEEPGHSIER